MQQADFRARPQDSGEEALPLPTGTSIYESLTTKFVAFERLLSTLSEVGHSGYVKLIAPGANGIVLMRDGHLVETLYRAPDELQRGEVAIHAIHNAVEEGLGVLDIVALDSGIVDGLHGVASGSPMYPDLVASWVNAEGLVNYLRERQFTGSLIVSSGSARGVIIFENGGITASFTTTSRDLANDEKDVLALCSDPAARLEVRELQHNSGRSVNGSALSSAVSAVFEGEPAG
ncbi:MAG TPA: hypothetical protein VF137_06925 [Candidatus Dormibacteraeota bacterium]